MIEKSLREIFYSLNKYSTKWSGYFDVYERYLSKLKGKAPTLIEIGVADGGSTEMWLQYFKNPTIHGIDIDERWLKTKHEGDVILHKGDQGDPKFWDWFFMDVREFDVVIDDGGHTGPQQLVSLLKLFPRLKRGGIYIIEDVHTSYWESWGGGFRHPNGIIENSKNLIDLINSQHIQDVGIPEDMRLVFEDLYSTSYYNSMIVLEKGIPRPFIPVSGGKKDE